MVRRGLTVLRRELGRRVDEVVRPRFEAGHVPAGTVLAGAAAISAAGVLMAAGIAEHTWGIEAEALRAR